MDHYIIADHFTEHHTTVFASIVPGSGLDRRIDLVPGTTD